MNTVKIYNLTDIVTPVLKQYRLGANAFSVCGQLCAPGTAIEIDEALWARDKPRYDRLVTLGALAVGEPPTGYGKPAAKQSRTPVPALVATPSVVAEK